jgi:integrase
MAIWKRKRARGHVWMGDYVDSAGRRHRISAPTRDAVDKLRAKKLAACGQSLEPLGDPNMTVAEFAEQWLKRLANSSLKLRTIESYNQLYRCHVAGPLGPIRLRELRRTHVKELLNAKREQAIPGQTTHSLSKNTVRLIRATISVMLSEALDDELIKSNPAAVPSRRRGRKDNGSVSAAERQKAIRPFSDGELAKVLGAAREDDAEHHPLFLLLARTGMRPGESFALQWTDLDLTNRKILVERALSAGVIATTKTDGIRTVDMSQELAAALAALFKQREAQTIKAGWGEVPEIVFINAAGNQLDESRVRKRFARAMRKAGISGHRLYDLRHTFATALLAKGAPITYVAAQLGHAKPTTTLQHYGRWLPQASFGFVDRLDASGSFWHQSGPDPNLGTEPTMEEVKIDGNMKGFSGAPSRTRTADPLIKSQLLYQLS